MLITLVLELLAHWLSEHRGIVIGEIPMGVIYFVALTLYSVFTMWLMGRFKALAAKKKLQTA